MANIMAASMYMKIALVCMLVGTLLFVIGFSTVSWMVTDANINRWEARGVWKVYSCGISFCNYYSYGAWTHFGRSDYGGSFFLTFPTKIWLVVAWVKLEYHNSFFYWDGGVS